MSQDQNQSFDSPLSQFSSPIEAIYASNDCLDTLLANTVTASGGVCVTNMEKMESTDILTQPSISSKRSTPQTSEISTGTVRTEMELSPKIVLPGTESSILTSSELMDQCMHETAGRTVKRKGSSSKVKKVQTEILPSCGESSEPEPLPRPSKKRVRTQYWSNDFYGANEIYRVFVLIRDDGSPPDISMFEHKEFCGYGEECDCADQDFTPCTCL